MKTLTRTRLLIAAGALAAMPGLAAAHNYTYLEGGFLNRDYGPDDESGFRIAGSGDIHRNVALIGEYADTGDLEQISAGALFHTPLNNILDFTAGATYEHIEFGPADDNGFGLRTGLRWQNADGRLELAPEIRYVDFGDDDDTSLRVSGLYGLTPQLDLVAAVQGAGDDDRLEAGLRYNFGPRLTGR
ncbi:hypothetical protein C3942_19825 [Solimonas fluminis]|uniref:Outer membrane protein beta-barrel domain-containing protein n=1 Tax=Solimonas fluminis TaxID=2086571 RepID=A0A2S5TBC6_9GAMM|nr:hypothetical protein [Solimonas fluminis]PPE72148.1 hypothetical protein C3942_19825 [Solimonas fluminis]